MINKKLIVAYLLTVIVVAFLVGSIVYKEEYASKKDVFEEYEDPVSEAVSLAQKGTLEFKESDLGKQSIEILEQVLVKDEKNIDTLASLGYSYEIMGEYDKALEYYNRALKIDNQNSFIYNKIGHVYDLKEGASSATSYYEKALELDSTNMDAKINLARVYYRENKIDLAEDLFEEAYGEESINGRAKAELGYVLSMISMNKEDYKKAKEYINEAKEADPALPIVWTGLGKVRFVDTKDANSQKEAEDILEEVLGYFDKAIELYPHQTEAYFWKGRILSVVGREEEAQKAFEKALVVVEKDIALMQDERKIMRDTINDFISEMEPVSFFEKLILKEAFADNNFRNWAAAVIAGSTPGHSWAIRGNTAVCVTNQWTVSYNGGVVTTRNPSGQVTGSRNVNPPARTHAPPPPPPPPPPPRVSATSLDVSQHSSTTYCLVEGIHNFSWAYSSNRGRAQSRFEFQVDNNSNFSSPEIDRDFSGLSNSSPTTNNQAVSVVNTQTDDKIFYNDTYYWRIRLYDSTGLSSGWTNGPSFSTAKHAYPLADFNWTPDPPNQGGSVYFNNKTRISSDPATASYLWKFVDAGPQSSTLENPVVIFSSTGVKETILKSTDADGYSCSATKGDINVKTGLPDYKEI